MKTSQGDQTAVNPRWARYPDGVPVRLTSEIEWYRKMADRHMRRYETFKTIQIVIGVSIPVAALLVPEGSVRGVTAVLGCLVAGIEAFLQFRQFNQHWMRWRATEQDLTSEMWLYAQNAGKYVDSASKSVLLANTTEEIIRKERQGWAEVQKKVLSSAGAETAR
jgi:hypothetical protein